MGCTPSSQNFQVNDNETRLLQEIDRLRTGHQSQELEINRLRVENEKLRQGQLNGGYENALDGQNAETDEEDVNYGMLVKEIERLKLQQQEKDKEISELRQNNEDLNVKLLQTPHNDQVLCPGKVIIRITIHVYSSSPIVVYKFPRV